MSAPRFHRQHCFLCDLPHSPWAILHDFSETVCRGCCNYEGADRIEDVIHYSRILRRTWESNEANRNRSSKTERLNSAGSSMSSTPSPPPANGANSYPPQFSEQRKALGKHQNAHRGSEESVENVLGHGAGEAVNGCKGPRSMGNIASREMERRGSNFNIEDVRHAAVANGNTLQRQHPPLTPNGPQQNFVLDGPRPEVIRESLSALNRSCPFDIRFKKDYGLIGRVFAFDVSCKPGIDFELKIFIEYPRGSGCVFQSASGVAKQMCTDSLKEIAKPLSSGFKYLEYEKDRSTGEWRLLGDFLPEPVRLFKEAINPEFLAKPQLDPEYPVVPHVNLSFNRSGPAYGRKRKGALDLEEFEIAAGKRMGPVHGRVTRDDTLHGVWVPSQSGEAVKLPVHMQGTPLPPGTPVTSIPSASVPPMVALPVSKANLVASEQHARGQVKSPMGTMVNRFELPPSSVLRDDSRNGPSTLVPVSPNTERLSPRPRQSPRPSPGGIKGDAQVDGEAKGRGTSSMTILTCSLCHDKLEDTHFVQCPSVNHHKFCFPCSRESIKKQGAGSEVFCPSGERCPLQGSDLPWAFMQGEIATILGTAGEPYNNVKKEKEA